VRATLGTNISFRRNMRSSTGIQTPLRDSDCAREISKRFGR
jgi:hypothetical protein